jgi:dihydroxyacetone kinase-like protein
MKKILNEPRSFVDDMLDGVVLAHPEHFRRTSDSTRALTWSGSPVPGKVGIVTGGGSGHLPLFLGYVGRNLLDGVAVGNVFTAPPASAVLAATRAVSCGNGVLHLFGNYAGDVLNFGLAAEAAQEEGIDVQTVIVGDDILSAESAARERRRGIAGLVLAYKIAGAKAALGGTLSAVVAAVTHATEVMASAGVALTASVLPDTGVPSFEIGDDEMEIGMGIHGEPGIQRTTIMRASAIADYLVPPLLREAKVTKADAVTVLVNGLGATAPCELYILFREVHRVLAGRGVSVERALVGEYATSMEMKGCSVSIMRMDEELRELLDVPCYSPLAPHLSGT